MVEPKFEQFIAEKYAKYKGLSLVNEAEDAEKFLQVDEPENPGASGEDPEVTTTAEPGKQEESSSCSCASGAFTAVALLVCAVVSLSVAVIKKVR